MWSSQEKPLGGSHYGRRLGGSPPALLSQYPGLLLRLADRPSSVASDPAAVGDRSDQACDWNVIINTRVMIV